MKIGTRITLTTSVLMAVTLGTYGYVSLRSLRADREAALRTRARELGASLRVALESRGWDGLDLVAVGEELTRGLSRARSPWTVVLLDAADVPPPDSPPTGDPRRERLRQLTAARTAIVDDHAVLDGRPSFVYLEPVRAPSPLSPDGYRVVGAVELTRDKAFIEVAMREDALKVLVTLVAIIAALLVAVSLIARRTIGRPIEKLLAGVDDVAKGDLSHVLLQERDDEVGALAARFNDMTASLRDARAETRRGLEAKLALEAHLRRTEKLATIGQVAAEIAHEVGTPLNVVTGRARAMSKKAEDPEAVQKNAAIIAEQAARITRIIQRLLDFARRRVGDSHAGPIFVDVNQLAADTIEFLEHQLANARIQARAVPDEGLGKIPGDKDQIQQVLLNLYMNAIQAMPDGGRLEVRTSQVVRRRPGLEVAAEQRWAIIEVADTGVGIPEANREKIFEPFYTSKGDQGTGLGLVVAHGIVKDHDGWVEIADHLTAGRGTVFRVYLPAGEKA